MLPIESVANQVFIPKGYPKPTHFVLSYTVSPGRIYTFNWDTGKFNFDRTIPAQAFNGQLYAHEGVASFSPNGRYLLCEGDACPYIRLFDFPSMNEYVLYDGLPSQCALSPTAIGGIVSGGTGGYEAAAIAWSEDSRYVVIGRSTEVSLFRVGGGLSRVPLPEVGGQLRVGISPNGRYVFCGNAWADSKLYYIIGGTAIDITANLETPSFSISVTAVIFSKENDTLIVSNFSGPQRWVLWRRQANGMWTIMQTVEVENQNSSSSHFALSPDGKRLSNNYATYEYDPQHGIGAYIGRYGSGFAISYDPSNRYLGSCPYYSNTGYNIRVYDTLVSPYYRTDNDNSLSAGATMMSWRRGREFVPYPRTSPSASVMAYNSFEQTPLFDSVGQPVKLNDAQHITNESTLEKLALYGTKSLQTSIFGKGLAYSNAVDLGGDDFTIECTFKQNPAVDYHGTTGGGALISQGVPGKLQLGQWALSVAGGLTGQYSLRFEINTTLGEQKLIAQGYVFNELPNTLVEQFEADTMHHAAVTRYKGTFYLFLNGKLQNIALATGGFNASASLMLGGAGNSEVGFDGLLDEVRVIKGKALYRQDFDAPATPLPVASAPIVVAELEYTPPDASELVAIANVPSDAQVGDISIVMIMHRETLTQTAGYTLVTQSPLIVLGTTTDQWLSVYSKVLTEQDIGSTHTFQQLSSSRIHLGGLIIRNATILTSTTSSAVSTDYGHTWPGAPITASRNKLVLAGISSLLYDVAPASGDTVAEDGWVQVTPINTNNSAAAPRLCVMYKLAEDSTEIFPTAYLATREPMDPEENIWELTSASIVIDLGL